MTTLTSDPEPPLKSMMIDLNDLSLKEILTGDHGELSGALTDMIGKLHSGDRLNVAAFSNYV